MNAGSGPYSRELLSALGAATSFQGVTYYRKTPAFNEQQATGGAIGVFALWAGDIANIDMFESLRQGELARPFKGT